LGAAGADDARAPRAGASGTRLTHGAPGGRHRGPAGPAMNLGAFFRVAIAFAILILLHYTLRPLLAWRAEIDFLVIAVLLAAVRLRPGAAAVVGCLVGLAADSLTPNTFGTGALAMTGVGFAASWLKAVFFADNLALNGFFFFVGKWAYDVIRLVAERNMTGPELVLQAFAWSTLSAAATALAGVTLLLMMRPLLQPSSA
ncbi:MAG: Permease of the drug/metabolite transporter (DMT) superfamily, partial [uncultured Gemmatimonadaceae bacterium]